MSDEINFSVDSIMALDSKNEEIDAYKMLLSKSQSRVKELQLDYDSLKLNSDKCIKELEEENNEHINRVAVEIGRRGLAKIENEKLKSENEELKQTIKNWGIEPTHDLLLKIEKLKSELGDLKEQIRWGVTFAKDLKKRINPSGIAGGYSILDVQIYTMINTYLSRHEKGEIR